MHQHQQREMPRAHKRTQTRFHANVATRSSSSQGVIKDLSANGICFQLRTDIQARLGMEVKIDSEELGHITGTVQWVRGDRIGVRLKLSSNTAAQISSYFKYFH